MAQTLKYWSEMAQMHAQNTRHWLKMAQIHAQTPSKWPRITDFVQFADGRTFVHTYVLTFFTLTEVEPENLMGPLIANQALIVLHK